MATEQVLIEFQTDTTQLEPALTILEKMGQIDAKTAAIFKKGNDELEKRKTATDKVTDSTKKAAEATDKAAQASEKVADAAEKAADATDKVAAATKKATDATDKQIVSAKTLEKSLDKAGKALVEAVGETAAKGLKETATSMDATAKSAGQSSKALFDLKQRREELVKSIKKEEQALRELQDLQSKMGSKSAFDSVAKPIADSRNKLFEYNEELNKINISINEFEKSQKQAYGEASKGSSSLRTQLRLMKEEIAGMVKAGDTQSVKYKELTNEAAKLEQAMKLAGDEVRRTASQTALMDDLITTVNAGVGAYSAFAGAAALAGGQNEEFQQTMTKLMAVMSIMNGLQAVQTELVRNDSLVKKGVVVIQKAWTAAISETNVALRITKVALMATGIGAFVALLGAIVANWDKIKDAITGANEATKAHAREQERLNAVHEKSVDGYAKEALQMESLTDRVRKGNLSVKEREAVVKDYNEQFGKSIGIAKNFEDAEKKIIKQGSKYIEMLQLKAEEHAAFDLAVEASREALKNEQKALDEYVNWWDATKAYIRSGGSISKASIRLSEQAAEEKKAEQARLKENQKHYTALGQQRREAARALAEENNFATEDAKKNAKAEVDVVRAALEEKRALRQKELLGIKENTQAYIDKQKEIIEVEKQLALHSAQGINQRALIIAEAEQKIADLQKAFDLKKAEERNDLEVTNARNRIAIIQQAGQDELQARKDLLDIEAEQQKQHVQDSIDNEELRAAKILEIENKLNADKKALQDDADRGTLKYDAEIAELKRAGQILAKERELIGQKDKKAITKINDEIKNLRLQSIQDEIDLNESLFQRGLIKREEYERAKIGLANKYAQEQLNIDKELADKQIKIEEDKAARQKEIRQQLEDAAFEIAQAGLNAIFEINKAQRDAQLQYELSALDAQRQKEINNKNLTENQKAEIDKRYREKERQAKMRAWKADKQAAKTQAVINGALAVVKALPNLILAGVAAAMTAIQIATINAQPIPAFAKGTKNAPKGYALVGEEGPEVVYFKGGERVFTHTESKTLMKGWEKPTFTLPSVKNEVVTTTGASGYEKIDYEKLGEAIARNVPQTGIDVDNEGFVAWMKQGNNRIKFKNIRYKL